MTYEQVEQTAIALEAEGLRVSAAKILQRIGGSKRDVVSFLRQLRAQPEPLPVALGALGPLALMAPALRPAPPQPERNCSVVRYRVTSARFSRITTEWQASPRGPDLPPLWTKQLVGPVRIPQGTILDDVTPDELAAFPDVFECVRN